MDNTTIYKVFERLEAAMPSWEAPLVDAMGQMGDSPYRILVATILSLRTRDTVTAVVAPRLFAEADTPQAMVDLPVERISELIRPVNYYDRKAETLQTISQILLDEYDGKVPDSLEQLLELPGVGRKTANLVITAGFDQYGICVDTHVHRISNRFGYVQTKNPNKTELALREKLPLELWKRINGLLVALGQNVCHPVSPRCSICPVNDYCERVGVTYSR